MANIDKYGNSRLRVYWTRKDQAEMHDRFQVNTEHHKTEYAEVYTGDGIALIYFLETVILIVGEHPNVMRAVEDAIKSLTRDGF